MTLTVKRRIGTEKSLMTSREAMLDFGDVAYFVGIPLLFGGAVLGIEAVTFTGAVLALVSIAVIAAS